MKKQTSVNWMLRFLGTFALLPLAVGVACRILPQAESTPTTSAEIRTQVSTTLTAAATQAGVSTQSPAGSETATASQEATAQTTPGGTPSAPVLTPGASAGLQVAFVSEGDAWIWDESGEARRLTEFGDVYSVKLSDDGSLLAFLRQLSATQSELWMVESSGENLRVLEDVAALTDMDPGAVGVVPHQIEWVPGSPVIAYNTREMTEGPGLLLYNDLRLVDTQTLDHSTLLAPGDGGMFSYSPDGDQIVVVTPERISLVSSDASQRQEVLAYEPVLTYSEYAYYAKPVWAPDGSYLRVAIPPSDPLSDPNQPTTLWLIPTDSSPAEQVGMVVANIFSGSEPTFSPDLELMAYTRRTGPSADTFELHLAAPDGSDDRVYTTRNSLFFESWTDQPGTFVYSALGTQHPIFYLGSLGAEPEQMAAEEENVASLKWVGDGRYLVITGSYASQVWQLSLRQAGAEPVSIAELSGALPAIDFNP